MSAYKGLSLIGTTTGQFETSWAKYRSSDRYQPVYEVGI